MSIQINNTEQQAKGQRSATWFWVALGLAGGVGTAVAVLPGLSASLSGEAPHAFWYISRASAFVAYVLIWMSMMAGLGITSKLARNRPGMSMTYEVHRYAGLLGLGFAILHALVLLGDKYINYSITQLLVPFMGSNYKPEWVGFGQVSIYIAAIVSLSFYVRDRIGVMTWRLIHVLSFALFLMAMIHGMQSGTDSGDIWAQALYWGSAASVLFGTIFRVISARVGRHKQALAGSGLVAQGGRSQRHLVRPVLTRSNINTRN